MKLDSVHFYVNDANNTSNWFIQFLGFQIVDRYQNNDFLTIAIASLSTKQLFSSSIIFIISSPLNNCNQVAHYLKFHAEGIVNIAFRVDRLESIIKQADNHQIQVLKPIQKKARIQYACLAGWGDLQHTLIESVDTNYGYFYDYLLPNGQLRTFNLNFQSTNNLFTFTEVDHIVLNVAQGKLLQAVNYYQSLFDFQIQQQFQIKTTRSGLHSQALIDPTGNVQFNINEPTSNKSQIQEFIDFNGGAGIQHLALKSANLIQDVAKMRYSGLSFLPITIGYYQQLKQRLKRDLISLSDKELQAIIKQEILIDWHTKKSNSLLLQIFTQPIFNKPTFFLEFIERRQQAIGFGEGNFHALFTAVEQNQLKFDALN